MGLASKKNSTSAGKPYGFNRIYGAEDGKETPYMTRLWVGRLRLHIFHRGDQDPDCHDHPWGFWTFPFRSYVEEVLHVQRDTVAEPKLLGYYEGKPVYDDPEERPVRYFRTRELVKAFRLHYRPATYRHRVLGPWDGYWTTPFARSGTAEARMVTRRAESIQSQPNYAEGKIPTLVWTEKPSRKWGFTKFSAAEGIWCWVPWRRYVYDGGKTAPCAEIEQEQQS